MTDCGHGIDSLILPKAVLRRGFSTKPSLGFGYTIMLEVADRVLLCTGTSGTTVVLIRNLRDEPARSLGDVVDTWEGIGERQDDSMPNGSRESKHTRGT